MLAYINNFLNQVRQKRKDWTTLKDKTFHDQLFEAQNYKPFNFSYFGYLTINRFADFADPYIRNIKSVLDLGCGPAEITCELARRFPEVSFVGVDHSPMGIERAIKNAKSLKLENIRFLVTDIEHIHLKESIDLITMFDSFHHLMHPHKFIKRMAKYVSQFFLIEPRGNLQGDQVRDFDFDWIISDLEKIRYRISSTIQESQVELSKNKEIQPKENVEAVENRYNIENFFKIFKGFGLQIRGTVSGLDKYPPQPYLESHTREIFGEKAYEIFSELDSILYMNKIDLLAKHWVIYASKQIERKPIKIPDFETHKMESKNIKGPFDVEFVKYSGPIETFAGIEFRAQIRFINRSYRILSSQNPDIPDLISYHWLDEFGTMIIRDGLRTTLPKPINPDEELSIELKIVTPQKPGKYILAIDFVQEGKTWYSDAGNPCYWVQMKINSSR